MKAPHRVLRFAMIALIALTSFGGSFTCNSTTDTDDKTKSTQQP